MRKGRWSKFRPWKTTRSGRSRKKLCQRSAGRRNRSRGKGFLKQLAPLLLIHIVNVFFSDTDGLVQPGWVPAQTFEFHSRKPFARVLAGLSQRFQMTGPHQDREVIGRPTKDFG